jgi:hypothetical protein
MRPTCVLAGWYVAGVDEAAFWDTIGDVRARIGSTAEFHDALRDRLRGLPAEDLLDFNRLWIGCWRRAYTWPVWDGATLLFGYIGDDGFMDFRHWLISHGRETYEGALRSPDSLADLAEHLGDFFATEEIETLGSEAGVIYHEVTGQWPPDRLGPDPEEPEGTPVDLRDDQVVAARFPRLHALTPPIQ